MISATGYEESNTQLKELVRHIWDLFFFENKKHGVVIRKYAVPERGAVSTIRIKKC